MKLQAGRELDALVAEKVMGWVRTGAQDWCRPLHKPSKDYPGRILNTDGKGPHERLEHPTERVGREEDGARPAAIYFCGCEDTIDLPAYSTSIEAAWKVVEEILGGCAFFIEHPLSGRWRHTSGP